ncbi:Uncharacterised protein [Vibrio cholerae]|uniref:Uncharacterized protein n=1 Tax=Vibrio cholerae TaxID=666 RepID=A0A655XUC1_VIBCL|nr:Uncharacterised protein [Vibrio cholerae]CSI50217.1 Uncharacterised protein [Vibrio cholerae]
MKKMPPVKKFAVGVLAETSSITNNRLPAAPFSGRLPARLAEPNATRFLFTSVTTELL